MSTENLQPPKYEHSITPQINGNAAHINLAFDDEKNLRNTKDDLDLRKDNRESEFVDISINGNAAHINLAFDDEKKLRDTKDENEFVDISKCQNPEDDPEYDPWKLPEVAVKISRWSELTTRKKVKRVIWDYFGRITFIFLFLYLFVVSLDFLSAAFQLLGGKAAGRLFKQSDILTNPVAGVMMGALVTVFIQSSSTTTAVIITMAAEDLLSVRHAIPILMGANIGTSITNSIVAMGQVHERAVFRRAFAGATIHDFFNFMSVLVLLPLELATGYLERLSGAIVTSLNMETQDLGSRDILRVITKPLSKLIIEVDKRVIEGIAEGALDESTSLIKHCCQKESRKEFYNRTITGNDTDCTKKCEFIFEHISNTWSDSVVGAIMLVIALVLMLFCLICIVKLLHGLLKGQIALVVKKVMNSNFPGKLSFLTGYVAILIGAGITMVIQSSSVFTSSLTPLVGLGIVSIERMYPLTIGANIGTTFTGILSALAQKSNRIDVALRVAFCHMFFNASGTVIWYVIPFMRLPIHMCKFLGITVEKYRWFAIMYLVVCFFVIPGIIFALTIPPWYVGAGIFIPIASVLFIIIMIKLLQNKLPKVLPEKLRDWKFLPEPLRSLAPLDRVIQKVMFACQKKKDVQKSDVAFCNGKCVVSEKTKCTKM